MSNAAAGGGRHAGSMQVGHEGAMQVGRALSTVGERGAAACRRGMQAACRTQAGHAAGACRRGMQAGHAGGMPVGGAVSTAAEHDACRDRPRRRHARGTRCVQRRCRECNRMGRAQHQQAMRRPNPKSVLDPPKLPSKIQPNLVECLCEI